MLSTAVITAATTLLLVVAATVNAASFGANVRSTRCNVDPNNGEVNNPCGSLYDAECGGEYCRCPVGTGVHPNLRRCMRGYDDNDDDNGSNNQGSQSDLFDDLPFDYVPPGSKSSDTPDISTDVSDTRCGGSYDPCASRYGAVCSGGRCRCPAGTKHSATVARCDPDPTYNRNQNHRDHDNGDHYDDDDDDSWFGGNSGSSHGTGVHVVSVAVLGALAGRWLAGSA